MMDLPSKIPLAEVETMVFLNAPALPEGLTKRNILSGVNHREYLDLGCHNIVDSANSMGPMCMSANRYRGNRAVYGICHDCASPEAEGLSETTRYLDRKVMGNISGNKQTRDPFPFILTWGRFNYASSQETAVYPGKH